MEENKNSWYRRINPLHFLYVIIILLILMVLMFSYCYSGEGELVKLISFAGTVASIILSVVAIFMTILSNDSISGMLNNIRNVSDSIRDVPTAINKSVDEISNVTSILRGSFDGIRSTMGNLEETMGHVDGEVTKTSAKLEEILNKKENVSSANIINTTTNNKVDFSNIVNRASYYGLVLMYAMNQTFKNGAQKLSLSDLASILRCPEDYLVAYAVALSTTDIVSFTLNDLILSNVVCDDFIDKCNLDDKLKLKDAEVLSGSGVESTLEKELEEINKIIMNSNDDIQVK